LLTENPATLRSQQRLLENVIVTMPGFATGVLDRLGTVHVKRSAVFSGSITSRHQKRAEALACLLDGGIAADIFASVDAEPLSGTIGGLKLALWHVLKQGSLAEGLRTARRAVWPNPHERHCESLRKVANAPVFGMQMYRTLAGSKLVINAHIDVAGGNAGNMRMIEATGVGSCLVTDHGSNIEELFVPGKEVVTYGSKRELVEKVRWLLSDEEARKTIARAGQERTLKSHTLDRMLEDIAPALGL